jgi:hypothetical protein
LGSGKEEIVHMNKQLAIALALSMVVAFIGITIAQAGMMGGQMPIGQSPKAGEERPGEQPGQMPMPPELAARMINACIGAMEGMAQMGGIMGGQRGTEQAPSEQRQ